LSKNSNAVGAVWSNFTPAAPNQKVEKCRKQMCSYLRDTTLAQEATLLTRNAADFARVPGLRFENWLE